MNAYDFERIQRVRGIQFIFMYIYIIGVYVGTRANFIKRWGAYETENKQKTFKVCSLQISYTVRVISNAGAYSVELKRDGKLPVVSSNYLIKKNHRYSN